jgi:hypothetical protein
MNRRGINMIIFSSILDVCKVISLLCSSFIFLFLLLHDWIAIYPFNDLATFNKHCSLRNKILMTVFNAPFFLIYTLILLYYWSTPFSFSAKMYLLICNTLFFTGILFSWWIPYFFGWPVEQTKELHEVYGKTHSFLPRIGNNPIPNTMHVIFHLICFINMIVTGMMFL